MKNFKPYYDELKLEETKNRLGFSYLNFLKEQVINEMPEVGNGNWETYTDELEEIGDVWTKQHWKFITNIKTKKGIFELRKSSSSETFILGSFGKVYDADSLEDIDKFEVVANLKLYKDIGEGKRYGVKKLVQVNSVVIEEDHRDKKIGLKLYKYLVNNLGYSLMSDELQYFGARRLYSRLSKNIDINVKVIDLNKEEVLENDIRLNHGKSNHEFDPKYYSNDNSKSHIRFIITKIGKL